MTKLISTFLISKLSVLVPLFKNTLYSFGLSVLYIYIYRYRYVCIYIDMYVCMYVKVKLK